MDAFSSRRRGEQQPARVVEHHRDSWVVHGARGPLRATIAGRLRHRAAGPHELPAVGDWVGIHAAPGDAAATIVCVLPRTSALVRDRTRRADPQVLAANLDTVFVVTAVDGDWNPRRLERLVSLVWESRAQPVVVVNKIDACDDAAPFLREAEATAPGVPAVALSAATGAGLGGLAPWLRPARTAALVGSSGVGKSTLVNRLVEDAAQATLPVRADDSRGRHTTVARRLFVLEGGGLLIDMPGLREVVAARDGEAVGAAFRDVEELAARCRFRDCAHAGEPGCAIEAALADGRVAADRWEAWQALRREAAFLRRKVDRVERAREQQRWKQLSKRMRRYRHREGE